MSDLPECSHVQAFEIYDVKLAVDQAQRINRSAMILPLANNGNFNTNELENFWVIDMTVEPVKRKLPLDMKEVTIEEIEIWLYPYRSRTIYPEFLMMLQQINVAQAL